MSPNCRGTSFGGSVPGRNMAPKSGLGVVRVQDKVRAMVSWIEEWVLCVADRVGCVCPYPSESYPGWRCCLVSVVRVAAFGDRYWIEGSVVDVAGVMGG